MSEMFDDMSRPIKFNTEINDIQFGAIINDDVNYEWTMDVDDFYTYYFDTLDNSIILGADDVIVIDGPLISGTQENEGV